MKHSILRGTGIRVSELCLGTSTFGGQTDIQDAIEIIHCALENGINFIDTADYYNQGNSEIAVGTALKGRRDCAVLATKVFFPTGGGINQRGLSRLHIISGVEKSLKNLKTDYIDLYYMHAPDYETPFEESLEAMASLVRSGKVRYIGVSNYAAWQICEALWISDKRNYVAPVVTQNGYNLISRSLDSELVPFIENHHIGMVAYQPLAAGMLTGKYTFGMELGHHTRMGFDKQHHNRYWTRENFVAIEKLTFLAEEAGISLLSLAMKWCASRPFVNSVIIGVSRLEQLQQNLEAIQGDPLSLDILEKCDEIWKLLSGSQFQYNR